MENNKIDNSKKLKKRYRYRQDVKAYSLLAFPLGWWTVFFVIAFFSAFIYSFTNAELKLLVNDIPFTFTLKNYTDIFNFTGSTIAKTFWKDLGVTALWTFAMTFGNNIMGLICAFLINSLKKGKRFFLALLFWPSLVSGVVGSDVTKLVFGASDNSLANIIIRFFGGTSVDWLHNEQYALFSIMITPFFLGFCTKMLIYYSSIVSIPKVYYEAAELETKSKGKTFMTVTLPLIKNAVMLNLILSIIDGFKILGPMQLVTNGGYGTESLMLYLYKQAFELGKYGRACAFAIILFAIIIIFTLIQKKLTGKEVNSVE